MTCLMFQRRLSNITTKERLELATTLSVLPWDIFDQLIFQNLIAFRYPFIYKTIAFPKIKLLFVTPSFENNCFFHKFDCFNTPKSG